jgi:hypothetical protein
MVVNTWDGAANTDWSNAGNWNSTGTTDRVPTADDNVFIPDTSSINNPTLTADVPVGSLDILANGTLVGAGFKITVHQEDSNVAVDNDGIISGNLDLEIQTAGVTTMDLAGTSGTIRHLTINDASCVATMYSDVSLSGDLTITAGQLTTGDGGYGYSNLTVAGGTSIPSGGTLTCNTSAISLGSGVKAGVPFGLNVSGGTFTGGTGTHTIGSIRFSSGTFVFSSGATELNGSENVSSLAFLYVNADVTHSGGTITVTTDVASNALLYDTDLTLNDLIIDSGAVHKIWTEKSDGSNENTLTCAGDLTITDGTLNTRYSSQDVVDLTVTGDVDVTGTLTGNASAISMGSLTIASGGTYEATSGTTTITGGGANGDSDTSFYGHSAGTFTHNNGTLVFDACKYRIFKGGTFYNVTVQGEIAGNGVYNYTGSPLPVPTMPDGTSAANTIAILGTLHIKNDEWRPYTTDKIYIHNLIIGDGTGSSNSATFDMSEDDAFDGTVWVDNVTIHSDGRFLFGDGDETSSTAGSSALNIYGAFRNLGGSVDIT